MTDFIQLLVAGVALGAVYALICLGFVIIYRSTGVINFAQGGFVVLGGYLTHQFAVRNGWPFPLAMVAAMAGVALVGALIERWILRRLIGQPIFGTILVTLGLLFVIEQACTAIWGYDLRPIGDPWGVRTVSLAGAPLKLLDLWTIGAAAAVLALFFGFFRATTIGVAMRAAAVDPEAALAHGISPRVIHGLAWSIAGAVAVVAGVLVAAGPKGVDLTIGLVAFRAFPAMILGGLESAEGAVVGGVAIGVTEVMTAAYLTPAAPWLGTNVHVVMPYLVMILILLVRPYGLFGTPEVRRV